MNEQIEELENILDMILRGVQEALQNGEVLSEELQMQIAQEITTLTQEIDQLHEESQNQAPSPEQPISPDAQLLWILAGQQEQAFISYLRDYPTPQTKALLNNPTALSHTIDQLSRMMPQGEQPVIDGIQHADLNSSNIWGTAYDPRTGKMKVRFQGGSEYEYDGVPQNIYRAFAKGNASAKTKGKNQYGEWWPNKNPSLGAAMNQYIKAGGFNYRRIR
jgi:hypothetical protein